MLIADTGTASSVIFLDNVPKYFTEGSVSEKMCFSIYETHLVCRSIWLVALDSNRTAVGGLDDSIRAASIDAT